MLGGAPVFLTGPPGAGKTYVLNEFIRRAVKRGKKVAVTASTGIAATHIGGTTIHSWSGLGIRDQLSDFDKQWLRDNERLRKRYASADILVIDEISMLHGKRLDMVNEACKILRDSDAPFGGLQVILVGDLFQLPPVNRGGEAVDFAHTSAAWAELNPAICYITEQHRQTNDRLLDVLQAMRHGEIEQWHQETLAERLGRQPDADTPVTRLYAHNVDVESINQRHLDALGEGGKTFTMYTKGSSAKVEQLVKSVLAPQTLELKVGAEVMFVANNFAEGFVNGSRGQVVSFENGRPQIKLLSSGRIIAVEPHSWTLTEDGKKRAEVVQLPLRLAWAITIHKSQGMSLDAAEIDLGKSFTPGMGYVALSRVRSLDGVFLTGMNNMAMQLHPDIFAFDEQLRRASEALASNTEDALDEAAEAAIRPEKPALNEELLAQLKRWRYDRAQREGMPPYIVAHDTALEALAAKPPATPSQLLATPGFGPKKVETYGEDILAITRGHTASDVVESSKANVTDATGWNPEKDTRLQALFRQGVSLGDVCAELDCSPDMVWDRLTKLVKE